MKRQVTFSVILVVLSLSFRLQGQTFSPPETSLMPVPLEEENYLLATRKIEGFPDTLAFWTKMRFDSLFWEWFTLGNGLQNNNNTIQLDTLGNIQTSIYELENHTGQSTFSFDTSEKEIQKVYRGGLEIYNYTITNNTIQFQRPFYSPEIIRIDWTKK